MVRERLRLVAYLAAIVSVLLVSTTACDDLEKPFLVRNNVPQTVNLRVRVRGGDSIEGPLRIAKGPAERLKPREELLSAEEAIIVLEGVADGRVGYIIIVEDAKGNELFRRYFPRQELVQRKFQMTITEQGIQ